MPNLNSLLTLVVALPCEAKPFLTQYNLKKDYTCKYFPVYRNKELGINLCVSGVGKVKVAACVAFMHQYLNAPAYLNVGIAGSGADQYGQVLLGNKIVDVALGHNYYPNFDIVKGLDSTTIYTHDRVVECYPEEGVVDMEASGFFKSATLFIAQDLLQSIKIVSDTTSAQRQQINASIVETLVTQSMSDVDPVVQAMLTLSREQLSYIEKVVSVDDFIARWHFTQYQKNELTILVKRWHILKREQDPMELVKSAKNAKEVLFQLKSSLDQHQYAW